MKEDRSKILESIVTEGRAGGTDSTRRSIKIGELSRAYYDAGRSGRQWSTDAWKKDKDAIQDKLKEQGCDTNVSRAVQVHALSTLVEEVAELPISVVVKFTSAIHWESKTWREEKYVETIPAMIAKAVKGAWTAAHAEKELVKANVLPKPKPRKKANPAALANAMKAIAKADVANIVAALLQCPAANGRLQEAMAELRKPAPPTVLGTPSMKEVTT